METQGIAVFDVCGTITRTNNTSDFIGFVLRRDSAYTYCLFLLIRILCSLCGLPGLRRIITGDFLRGRQIALLRGYSAARLREAAELYVDALVARRLLNERIVECIQKETGWGRAVFLVSAAIDPPVAAIAGRLNVKGFLSSELEIANGRCTGKLRSDLLGRKQAVLERIAANVDLRDSSVYSDNPEDAKFMECFGRRNVVLNTSRAQRMWDAGNGEFHFIVNDNEPMRHPDADSVTEGMAKWTYVPFLYYAISRFHRKGLGTLLFRELVPFTLVSYLFTDLGVFAFIQMPLSLLMFYCVYEIGGLVNDLHAGKEPPGRGTHRIASGVHIYVGLFVAIRIAAVTLLLAWLPLNTYAVAAYTAALGLCLAIYLVHTLPSGYLRVLTFTLLTLCRNAVPLILLVSHIPLATLVWVCTIFFIMNAPWRAYQYCHFRGLMKESTPIWHVRCAVAAILCGLGAVIYFVDGSPHLLAIASYYIVVECLRVVRATFSQSV